MKLLIFTILYSIIILFTKYNLFFMADLFLLSCFDFIVYILTLLFPFLGLFIVSIFIISIYKKDYYKYHTVLFISFILFCIGFTGFINAIQFEKTEYNKAVVFLIFSVSLLSLKNKDIKYIGSSFILLTSFLMRYYFIF